MKKIFCVIIYRRRANYTVIPDFPMLRYEILALTLISSTGAKSDAVEKAKEWTTKHPNIILASQGEGMNKNGAMISLHKSFGNFQSLCLNSEKTGRES